mgnify:CR=1 FL=1
MRALKGLTLEEAREVRESLDYTLFNKSNFENSIKEADKEHDDKLYGVQ